jgi:hypothetical protein
MEDTVDEGMEEPTIQEALPVELMDDVSPEESPVQEMVIEQTGIEEHLSDTEVVSKGSTELDEIEAMLNKEFPELEPLEPAQIEPSIEGEGQGLSHDPQAFIPLDKLAPDALEKQALSPEPTQVNGMLEEQPGELSLDGHELTSDPQASLPLDELPPDALDDQALSLEPTPGEGLLEEPPSELSLDGHELTSDPQVSLPLDELVPDTLDHQALEQELAHVEGITEEPPMTSAMEEEMHELNLDPQASMDMDEMTQHKMDIMGQESTQMEGTMGNHTIEPDNYSQTVEDSISNVSENISEGVEEVPSEHATHVDSVDDHLDHVNESVMETETVLEGHHL